jgi:hypothetical protein
MFSLRDGRSIRTVSALLFQLVQTSAHDVRVAARKIAKRRQSRQALRRQDSVTNERSAEPLMDELDAEVSANVSNISYLTACVGVTALYHGVRVRNECCKDDSRVFDTEVSKINVVDYSVDIAMSLDLEKGN